MRDVVETAENAENAEIKIFVLNRETSNVRNKSGEKIDERRMGCHLHASAACIQKRNVSMR